MDLNNYNKKIFSDDKGNNYNNEDDDSSFDSNIIYDDDEYNILDICKNDNLYFNFWEKIYQKEFEK